MINNNDNKDDKKDKVDAVIHVVKTGVHTIDNVRNIVDSVKIFMAFGIAIGFFIFLIKLGFFSFNKSKSFQTKTYNRVSIEKSVDCLNINTYII